MGLSTMSELMVKTSWFSVDSGVRQGCLVAPDLFAYVIDHLMTHICLQTTGVWFGNYHLMEMEYAGDSSVFSNTITDLKAGLNVF